MALVAEGVGVCRFSSNRGLVAAPRTSLSLIIDDRQLPRAYQPCRWAKGCSSRGPTAAKASDGILTAQSGSLNQRHQRHEDNGTRMDSPILPTQRYPPSSWPRSPAAGNLDDFQQQLQQKPQHHANDQQEKTKTCSSQLLNSQDPSNQQPLQQQADLLPLPQASTTWPSPGQQQQQQTLMPHPFCTLDHRLLTYRIKRCLGWHDAAVLFVQQSQCMNHINFAALITHLAQLRSSAAGRPVNWGSFVTQVLTASAQHLHLCSPRQLSNMAWGLSALGYSDWVNPDNTWTAQWQQQLQQQLHTASCRDISNVLWAAATTINSVASDINNSSSSSGWPSGSRHQPLVLQQQQHVLSSPRLQQELLSALHRELPSSTPQDVSNSLWALAVLNFNLTPELQQYLLIRTQTHSSHLKPQEVAQTLWALAQLRVQPPAEWLRELLLKQVSVGSDSARQPGHGSFDVCSGVLQAAQHSASDGRVHEAASGSGSQCKQPSKTSGRLDTTGSAVVDCQKQKWKQRQKNSQKQSTLLNSDGNSQANDAASQHSAGDSQQQQQQQKKEKKLKQKKKQSGVLSVDGSSQDSNAARRPSSLQCTDLQQQQQQQQKVMQEQSEQLSTDSSSQAIDAARQPELHQHSTGGSQKQQLSQSNAQNLIVCLVACAQLKQLPPDKWLNQTLVQLEVLLLQDSGPRSSSRSTTCDSNSPARDFANVIWALGSLGIKPHTAWMDKFLHASRTTLHTARPQELCNMIWGLGRLGVTPSRGWLQCFDAASGACMWGFTAQGLGDMLAAQHRLGLQPSGAWREGWMQGLKACWGSADAAAICKTLWAAAKFDLPFAKHWLQQALLQAHEELQRALVNRELSYEELLRLIWAVGRLRRGALHQSVSDMLGLHVGRAAAKMSWQQLKSAAQGLRQLRPLPRQQLLDYFCDLAESRMKYMPAAQAEDLMRYLRLMKDAAERQQQQQRQQMQQQIQQALHKQQHQHLLLQQQQQQQQSRALVGVTNTAASRGAS